jgi:tetratricopeptide (TPR) repeat protein
VTLRLHFLAQGPEPVTVDDQFMATFGRSSSADISIDNGHLSGMHGEFYMGPEGLVVRDLGSKNGIKINGQVVEEGLLAHGDRLSVGSMELFELVDDALPETGSKGLSITPSTMPSELAPSTELAVAETGLAKSSESQKPKNTKANPMIMIGGGVVALLVVLALLMGGKKETLPEDLPWTQGRYLKSLNHAVSKFRDRDYQESRHEMEKAIREFDQNNAAHVLSSLAGLWENKGDLYQTLQWGKAEALVEELMDVHPSTMETKDLAKDLLTWIRREEPHVANLQKAIRMIERGKWDEAEKLATNVPDTCKVKNLYVDHLARIQQGRLSDWKAAWEQADGDRDWPEAILTLERLRATEAAPEGLDEKLDYYRDQIEQKKIFREGKNAFDNSRWIDARATLSRIKEGQIGYDEAQTMVGSIEGRERQEKLVELMNRGDLSGAKDWITNYFPERKAELAQIERLEILLKQASDASRESRPEESLDDWKKVLDAAGSSATIRKRAEKSIAKWSNPKQLVKLFMDRGKLAEGKEEFKDARSWYGKAKELDGVSGVRELKDFERVAWLHYNRAVVFDKKGDLKNTHVYLRKALELTEKGSKLYDRVEVFTRQTLEKK